MLPDLPVLVLELVCGHLSYEDVLMLRSACKAMQQFVDGKQFTKLNLFVQNFSYHRRLFYTGKPVGHPHSLHSDDLTILDSNRFRERFANVQKMTVCRKTPLGRNYDPLELDLNHLNCFRALSHLEVDEFPRIKGKLNLKELKIAAFAMTIRLLQLEPSSSFELNCPRLRALKLRQCRPTLSGDTDQLDYLYYDDYFFNNSSDYLKSLNPNLRKVSIICLKAIGRLLQFLSWIKTGSLRVPSLSELKLEQCNLQLERLDELVSSLEDLKREPRTKHIEFTFNGRPIRSPDELRQIASLIRAHESEAGEPNRLEGGFLNYRSLLFLNGTPRLDFLLSADWTVELQENVELNENLIKRLKSVEAFDIGGHCKPSFSTIELFSRTCTTLRFGSFSHQVVTERLLEMMSSHLVNLQWLRIVECQYETVKPLVKFRNLDSVHLDFDPGRDELIFLFENSRVLRTIEIRGKDTMELLRRNMMSNVCKIIIHPDKTFEFDTLNSMIAYYHEQGLFEKREDREASTRLRT